MHRASDAGALNLSEPERAPARHPVLTLLCDPAAALRLDGAAWTRALHAARHAAILGSLAARIDDAVGIARVPAKVGGYLRGALLQAESNQRALGWELRQIAKTLPDDVGPVVVLKGMAYAIAGLPLARGRRATDVDILVARDALGRVERALLDNGWEQIKGDDYDDAYYRTWMHELPPLRHRQRGIVVDVHHALLPLTGRIRPDAEALRARARPVAGTRLSVLAPADMTIHCVVHLIQDGYLGNGLRDLLDLDGLLRHFGTDPAFWDDAMARIASIGAARPWFYGLRYARRVLGTPIPEGVLGAARRGAPARPVLWLMDACVHAALAPPDPRGVSRATRVGRFLLYVRSHWLRMPPRLLARHLLTKASRRRP